MVMNSRMMSTCSQSTENIAFVQRKPLPYQIFQSQQIVAIITNKTFICYAFLLKLMFYRNVFFIFVKQEMRGCFPLLHRVILSKRIISKFRIGNT